MPGEAQAAPVICFGAFDSLLDGATSPTRWTWCSAAEPEAAASENIVGFTAGGT